MLETGAVQSQDGASGSPDGERLSPASNEESQTHQRGQQQLVAVHVCVCAYRTDTRHRGAAECLEGPGAGKTLNSAADWRMGCVP